MEKGFDVCNLIRSDEIKKYYQEQVVVSWDEKIAIVLSSYKSLQDKTKVLNSLHEEIGVGRHEEIQKLIGLDEDMKDEAIVPSAQTSPLHTPLPDSLVQSYYVLAMQH